MPLLEINQVRHICASVRLDEETAAQVDQYAAFIRASADDVVDKALNYVFSKDRDFQEFLKTPQAKQVASTLRVRKVGNNGAAEQPGKKVAAGADGQVVIGLLTSCQCKSGASHRKNFDTPSLEGYWRGTLVPRCEPF